MLIVEALHARLARTFAITGVSFRVAPGETLAILGPNGSGKSTLLRLLAGLAAPDAGTIASGETLLSSNGRVLVPPSRRGLGVVAQQGALFPHLRVDENVALGVPPERADEERARLVDDALRTARIGHLARARVQRLSGGEAQRVALARALVQRPSVMLLDEPFHSLDAPVRSAIVADVRALVRELGLCAVLVTHDADEASALADRVLLLRDGRKVQEGALEELYRAPVDDWAAQFLGDVASLDRSRAERAGVALPPAFDGGTARFRPEALLLEPTDDDAGLRVLAVRRARALAEVTLEVPDGPPLVARCHAESPVVTGSRVRARVAWLLPAHEPGAPS